MLPMPSHKQLRGRGTRRQTGVRLPDHLMDWLVDEANRRGVSLAALMYEYLLATAKAGGYVEVETKGDGDPDD